MLEVKIVWTIELLSRLETVGDDRLDARLCGTRPEMDGQPPVGGLGHGCSTGRVFHLGSPLLVRFGRVSVRRGGVRGDEDRLQLQTGHPWWLRSADHVRSRAHV